MANPTDPLAGGNASSVDLLTTLSLRLRDTNQFGYPPALLTRLIDQCQRILNVNRRLVLNTVSFTTMPHRVLYRLSEIAGDVARVEMVRQDKRNLFDISWTGLTHTDPQWIRRHGDQLEYFSRFGNDILVLAPALSMPITVDVVYTTVPATPTGQLGDILIPREFIVLLQDMVEAVAMLRSRRLTEGANPMQRVKVAVNAIAGESIETGGR